jgi:hypothetical protein
VSGMRGAQMPLLPREELVRLARSIHADAEVTEAHEPIGWACEMTAAHVKVGTGYLPTRRDARAVLARMLRDRGAE